MSTSPIGGLSSAYLVPDLASLTRSSNTGGSLAAPLTDSTQLSPFAQLIATLQQLQQSNPSEYAQLTAQIATQISDITAVPEPAGLAIIGGVCLSQLAQRRNRIRERRKVSLN